MTKQSSSAIAPVSFDFNSLTVRTLLIDGNPWFVASDVAKALGYREAEKMTRMLDDDEKATHIVGTHGGDQSVTIISESGVYACVLKSRREDAKPFRKWVTAEVLPAIRKTGSYAKPQIALKDLRSKKALPGGLTLDQQDAIKAMVKTRAEEAPEAKRGIVTVKLWSALKAKFGCPYKLIPPEHFTDALSLLARLEIEGATLPAVPIVVGGDARAMAGQRYLVTFGSDGKTYAAWPIESDAYILNAIQFLKALNAGDVYLGRVETHLLMDSVDYLNRSIRFRMADILKGVVSH